MTVVGPGGVGKTRLVTEWVRRHGARFDGGAHVVSLAGEADAEGAVDRLTSRLGFGSFDALLLGTSAAPTVVVLDNCESAPGAARTVADALAATDGTARVVATSREALRAAGEHVHVLAPSACRRRAAPTPRTWRRPSTCSSAWPGRRAPAGRSTTAPGATSTGWSAPSTACPSPSSWRRPACGR